MVSITTWLAVTPVALFSGMPIPQRPTAPTVAVTQTTVAGAPVFVECPRHGTEGGSGTELCKLFLGREEWGALEKWGAFEYTNDRSQFSDIGRLALWDSSVINLATRTRLFIS